jgi:hypothetical protein
MGDLSSTITTATEVIADPYFSEALCRISQLRSVERGEVVAACTETPDGIAGGVGLRPLMPVLRAYAFAQQNQWVYPVAVLALLGLPMFIGYELGKEHGE